MVWPGDLSRHRWTVDTLEDFELISRLFEALYVPTQPFGVPDILATLQKHPSWSLLNAAVTQKHYQNVG
jgi:spore coat polysaccharide biosynthesis protein SpsF